MAVNKQFLNPAIDTTEQKSGKELEQAFDYRVYAEKMNYQVQVETLPIAGEGLYFALTPITDKFDTDKNPPSSYHFVFRHYNSILGKCVQLSKIITEAIILPIPGYSKGRVILDGKGGLEIHGLKTQAHVYLAPYKHCKISEISTQGQIRILCRSIFIVEGEIQCYGFYCRAALLKNRSHINGKIVDIRTLSGKLKDVSFDNRGGVILATRKLMVRSRSVDNRSGILEAKHFSIKSFFSFNNVRGVVLGWQGGQLSANDKILNQAGRIITETGALQVKSLMSTLDMGENGCIQALDGKAIVEASRLLISESALVRGTKGTKILTTKLCQEARFNALGGEDVVVETDWMNSNLVVVGAQHAKVVQKINRTLNVHRVLCEKADIEAYHLQFRPGTFQVTERLNLNLRSSAPFVQSFSNSGSIHLTFGKAANEKEIKESKEGREPIHILANIKAASSAQNLKRELRIQSYQHPIILGTAAKPIQLESTGDIFVSSTAIDLINASCRSGQTILFMANSLKLGRIVNNRMPSSILCTGEFNAEAKEKCELNGLYVYSGKKTKVSCPKPIDTISCDITTLDAEFDTPKFVIRQSYGGSLNAVSSPFSKLQVKNLLTTKGETFIVGAAQVSCLDHKGKSPHYTEIVEKHWVTENYVVDVWKSGTFWDYKAKETRSKRVIKPLRTHTPVFSRASKLEIEQKQITIVGAVSALQAILKGFDHCKIGRNRALILSIPQFKVDVPLFDSTHSDPLFKPHFDSAPIIMRSVIPLPLIMDLNNVFVLERNLLKPYDGTVPVYSNALQEEKLVVEKLMEQERKSFLDTNTRTAAELVSRLKQNARAVYKQQLSLDSIAEPILIYCRSTYLASPDKSIEVLMPRLRFPRSHERSNRHCGGYFYTLLGLEIRGNGSKSTLNITGALESDKTIAVYDVDRVHIERLVHRAGHQLTNTTTDRFMMLESSRHDTIEITTETPVLGGSVEAKERVEFQRIGTVDLIGGTLSGDKGVIVNPAVLNAKSIPQSKISESTSGDNNGWVGVEKQEHIKKAGIVPPKIVSKEGGVILTADRSLSLTATDCQANESIMLHAPLMKLDAAVVKQQAPTQFQTQGLSTIKTEDQHEKGYSTRILSEQGSVYCEAQHIQNRGTQMVALEDIKIVAEKSSSHEPLHLKETSTTTQQGMVGFSLINKQVAANHESGISPHFMAGRNIEFLVKNGSLILTAPVLFAGETLKFETPKGTVHLQPAVYHQDLTLAETSVGLSFFSSETLQALMRRNFKEAAHQLLEEFPFIASMEHWLKSKDTADKITLGMKALFHAYNSFVTFYETNSLWQFAKSQIPLSTRLRFGAESSQQHWTELALPFLQARHIVMKGKTIKSIGAQAKCNDLTIEAKRKAEFSAAKQEMSHNTSSSGASIGVPIPFSGTTGVATAGIPVNLGVDFAECERQAMDYLTSRFNVANFTTITAGGVLSLKGVYINTLKAIVQAGTIDIETLQGQDHSSHFSGSANNNLGFGLSSGCSDRKWAQEQSGLHARQTLMLKIKKEIRLIGATLTLGNEAKPIPARLHGIKTHFYEYNFGTQDLSFMLDITEERIFSPNQNPKLLLALKDLFKQAILQGNLAPELQNDQTRWLQQNSAAMAPPIFLEKLNAYLTSKKVIEFACVVMKNLNLKNNDCGNYQEWLTLLSQLLNLNIRVWEMQLEVLVLTFSTPSIPNANLNQDEDNLAPNTPHSLHVPQVELRYTPKNPYPWSLLYSQPGLIHADKLLGQSLQNFDVFEQTSVEFSPTAPAEKTGIMALAGGSYRAQNKSQTVNSLVSSNVSIQAKQTSGITCDDRKAFSEKQASEIGIGLMVPVGNPIFMARSLKEMAANAPQMFVDNSSDKAADNVKANPKARKL